MSHTVYCWGAGKDGQLGLGDIEKATVSTPTECTFLQNKKIKEICCGASHTLIVIDGGTVFSCGTNDHGQLGHGKSMTKPELINTLEAQIINRAACGHSHNLVVNDHGQVFSWGCNTSGQLGLGDTEDRRVPKRLKTLSTSVAQVSCGDSHSVALTREGQLYVWGSNQHGQLGVGNGCPTHETTPQLLRSLSGLPVMQVAAGGNHTFILTVSGALFGWGKNSFGQLGLSDNTDRMFPNLCKSLRSQKVKYVSCGQDHTAVLTKDGGVFTFGAGMYGQLGHGTTNNEMLPRKVFELMGSSVSQIACASHHTLAFVPGSGRLYAFGQGEQGQLGRDSLASCDLPQAVSGNWMTSRSSGNAMEVDTALPLIARCIYTGGDSCFTVMCSAEAATSEDFRVHPKDTQILHVDGGRIREYTSVSPAERLPHKMTEEIETIFSSSACLNSSFLLPDDNHYGCNSKNTGVDLDAVKAGFELLSTASNRLVSTLICSCLERHLISELPSSPPDVEALRIYLILPFMHVFQDTATFYESIICRFGGAIIKLDSGASSVLERWWGTLSVINFSVLVQIYKRCITHVLNITHNATDYEVMVGQRSIQICLEVLKKLNNVNEKNSQIVPYDYFYIKGLSEKVDIRTDYVSWIQQPRGGEQGRHSYCNYPFIFDAQAKTILLHTDAIMQMQAAVDEVNRRNLSNFLFPVSLIDPVCPCLILYITRDEIVRNTIDQLTKQGHADFKKPLKVMFVGEEAIDAGGVRKEFFMLLIREILDPKYGMFQSFEESRLLWFTDLSFEDSTMFSLIGKLCGLAIYNSTIIDLPFPTALYKKLLKRPILLSDMKELDPSIGKSLQQLLDYTGDDMEDVFCLNFEITRERYGEIEHMQLIDNGASIQVSQSNKKDYVDRYIDFVFNKAVSNQFTAFYDGFHTVCGGKVLELFHPQELQAMVVGNENYDWVELKKNTEYKGEYHPSHRTIKFFWEVFDELPLEKKKKFLFFLTGSDRIPILGMKAVKFFIQPVGGGEDYLPVAHTCFNLLDLPKYTTKAKLTEKLIKAIEQSQGFGLV